MSVIRCVKVPDYWCIIATPSKALQCGVVARQTGALRIGKALPWSRSRPDATKDFAAFLAGEIALKCHRSQYRPRARGGEPIAFFRWWQQERSSPRTWG